VFEIWEGENSLPFGYPVSRALAASFLVRTAVNSANHSNQLGPDPERQFLAAENLVALQSAELKKELRLGDLVLSQVVYMVGLLWTGTAGKLGSAHVMYWIPGRLVVLHPVGHRRGSPERRNAPGRRDLMYGEQSAASCSRSTPPEPCTSGVRLGAAPQRRDGRCERQRTAVS
jgi:hypothetical protein